jgi:hypothetical protein
MARYTTESLEALLYDQEGEMMLVLDSDREYTIHPHDTEFHHDRGTITTRGIEEGGHEYMKVHFPAEVVEHYYAHAEL